MLYLRMLLAVVIGLYTSRVVLSTLGVTDYGIYGVVGGIVSLLSVLNSAMSSSTSRFLTFKLGLGDKQSLAKTFSSSLLIHLAIAGIVVLLGETFGLWLLFNKLVIPTDRLHAAQIVYQLSILSTVFGFTQVPYNACIIAHEKLDIFAYVEMLSVTLKLAIVFLLDIGTYDKLILYAALVLCVSIIIMLIYRIYCIRMFDECKFHFVWDLSIIKPLLSFSGWNMYTSVCYAGRQQGFSFLLNMFGGAILNAAASLAATVDGIVSGFAYNIVTAFRPPLIKLYAMGDYKKMKHLLDTAVLVSLFLYFIVVVPIIVNANYVLKLWLGQVPPHTGNFLRIILIASAFSLINSIMLIAIHAVGKIKVNSIVTGSISFLILVPFYISLKEGINVDIAYNVVILSNLLISITHIYCIKKLLPQMEIVSITIKAFILVLVEYGQSYILESLNVLSQSLLKIGFDLILNILFITLLLLVLSTKEQKSIVYNFIHNKMGRQFK